MTPDLRWQLTALVSLLLCTVLGLFLRRWLR